MTETISGFVEELQRTFRVVDAIDILLVSVVLYTGLLWFKRAASRGVLVGLGALTVIYFLARGFDMYLTSLAFHTTFTVLLFILVVVFQEDLRRLLERLSSIRTLQMASSPRSESPVVDTLVEAVFKMAAGKIGALIILKGKEPLERHLNRGIALDGKLSTPLLLSIFDPHSAGHDGAVVVEHDCVKQFAAHLPISTSTRKVGGRGTRHSAALGLSERSDALTIAVSEERGCVSVAASSDLQEIATASELKSRLHQFFSDVSPIREAPIWNHAIFQNGRLKVVSLVLASVSWLVFAYDPNTLQRTFVAPIEYRNLLDDLELDPFAPTEARITLTGAERHFRFLDPAEIKISIDLANSKEGFIQIPISENNLRLPANLSPYRIEPKIVRLNLRPRTVAPIADPQPAGRP